MMKQRKRVVAALSALLLCLGLAGCGEGQAASGESVTQGLWAETEITPAEGLGDVLALQTIDGQLACVAAGGPAEDGPALYTSPDGGDSWRREELAPGEQEALYLAADLSEAGDLLLVTRTETKDRLWYRPAGGEAVPVDCSALGLSVIGRAVFFDAGRALVIGSDGESPAAGIFGLPEGQLITRVDADGQRQIWQGLAAAGSFLYYLSDDGLLTTLQPNGETAAAQVEIPGDVMAAAGDSEGNYYYVTTEGIHRITRGGSLREQVVPSDGIALSSPERAVSALACLGQDFVCAVRNHDDSTALYRYRYDPDAAAPERIRLTVWSLQDHPTVRRVLSAYQQSHRDVSFNYIVADTGEVSTEDLLQSLNTELLAGSGPDILLLDGIDIQPYIEKDLLCDLSALVQASDAIEAVKNAYTVDGKKYVAVTRYAIPALFGEAEQMAAIGDLEGFLAAVRAGKPRADINMSDSEYYQPLPEEERYAVSFLTPDELFRFLIETSAPQILRNNTVNTEQLTVLFGAVESIGTYYDMAQYRREQEDDSIIYSDGGDVITISGAAREFINGRAQMGRNTVSSPAFFGWIAKNAENDALVTIPAPGLCSGAYTPRVLVGVNAASAHQEAALEVVKTFYTAEIQDAVVGDGLPVSQSSLQNRITAAVESYGTEETMLTDFLQSVQTPVLVDEILYDKLLPYAEAVARGTQSVPNAVAGAEKDLRLYLAERR